MRESNNANRQDGTRIFRSEFSFSRPHEASEKGKMQFTNFRNDQEEIMIREERQSVTYLICSFAFFFFFLSSSCFVCSGTVFALFSALI